MKTVEEFIKEIVSSEALKTELKAVKDRDGLAAFLKKHDCDDASVKEYMDYVASMDEGEIDDDQAAAAAGGVDGRYSTTRFTAQAYKKDGFGVV